MENLDRTGLIHMNGRVYDPLLGRFLSPDPIVQAPAFSQSWNRYSYTLNNPLSAIDRSGYEAEAAVPDLDDCLPPVAGASWDCEPDTGDDWDTTGFNPSALGWLINRDNYSYARRTGSGILYFTYLEAYDEPIVMGYVPLPGRQVQGPAAEREFLARVQPEEGDIAQKGYTGKWLGSRDVLNKTLASKIHVDADGNISTNTITVSFEGISEATATTYIETVENGWSAISLDLELIPSGGDLRIIPCTAVCSVSLVDGGYLGAAAVGGRTIYYGASQYPDTPVHEFGHILGLRHSIPVGRTGSIMGFRPRSVNGDDLLRVRALYE